MKNISLLLAFLFLSLISVGQVVSEIDFDEIKAEINDPKSVMYYPDLVKRLSKLDTNLTDDDYKHLYYGQVFFDAYSPYSETDLVEAFYEKYEAKDYKKALKLGKKAIKKSPVNIRLFLRMMVCYHQLDDIPTARAYARHYFAFLYAILDSGDGKSIETAMVVANVHDEYEVCNYLELDVIAQKLVGRTDVLTLDLEAQEGPRKVEEIYFDVSMPFSSMSKMFKEK